MTTLTDEPARPGDADVPTAEDLIARAEALQPTLIAEQQRTEQRTRYSEEIHEEFRRSGFYRILVPSRYGGFERGIETFLRVTVALARGCPSTAWMYCFGAAHALTAATFFPHQAQADIFAGGDFIAPATIVPAGTAQRTRNGDWRISGTWAYCSGAPYANHFMGHALTQTGDGPPSPVFFIAPRTSWKSLDDWGDQLGLRGSGSDSIVMTDAMIPAHLVLEGVHISDIDVTGGTAGRALHGDPEYGGGHLSYMNFEAAALAVGMAKGALDVYEDLLRTRLTLLPPPMPRADHADYQLWHGDALGQIAMAEAALFDAVRQWKALSAAGAAHFTREQDLRLAAICRHVLASCWNAVQSLLFPTAGSSSVRAGQRLERIWRDLSTLHSHTGLAVFLPTVALRDLSRARLGRL